MKRVVKIVAVSMSMLLLASCAQPSEQKDFHSESSSQNTNVNGETSAQNSGQKTAENQSPEPLMLNTGEQLTIGGSAVAFVPYYSGRCDYEGKITNMYPETGEVWIRSKGGIMSFTYRYVVDVQVNMRTCQDDQMPEPETKEYSVHIRSVVTLSKQDDKSLAAEEKLLLIRDVDGQNTYYSHYKIVDSTEYRPVKWLTESELSDEMLAFYKEGRSVM